MAYTLRDVSTIVSGEVRGIDEIFLGEADEINEGRTGTAERSNGWLHTSTIDNLYFYARHKDECNTKSTLIM